MFYVYKRKSKLNKKFPIIECDSPGEALIHAYYNRHYYDDIKIVDEEGKPFLAYQSEKTIYYDPKMIDDGEELLEMLEIKPEEKNYSLYFSDENLSLSLTKHKTYKKSV